MNNLALLIRAMAARVDKALGSNLKTFLGDRYRSFLGHWSRVRRIADPLRIRIQYLLRGRRSPVKLHLGCGASRLPGFVNVDFWITEATDVICDIRKLPWPDESVSRIESYHVIEHISHRSIEAALREWGRVLIPGGTLTIECPNFDEAVTQYLAGNEETLIRVFGRQRRFGDVHLFGYNFKRLSTLLSATGFEAIVGEDPTTHLDEPSLRIVCRKGLSPQPGQARAGGQ